MHMDSGTLALPMFLTRRGSRRAGLALRVALLSLAAVVAGCSANPASGALAVEVVLAPGLVSRCVKVTSTDGTLTRETIAIPLAGKSSSLKIGVKADGLSQPVTVQAFGYSDEGCETLTPGEVSEAKEGNFFTNPPSTVTLTLRPVTNGDGGFDGGPGDGGPGDGGMDAGIDAGVDAGVDRDMDGYPLPDDCDDNDMAINPGATERCDNNADDDCNGQSDCQQTSCNNMMCAGGGRCMNNVCVGDTESVCNDGMDNNNNQLVDCADPDCMVGAVCTDGNDCTLGDRCVGDGGCEKVADFTCTTPPAAQCWVMAGTCIPDGGPSCEYTPMAGPCMDGLACTTGDMCSNGTCTAGTPTACNSPPNSCFFDAGACQEPSGTCAYTPRPAGTGSCDDGNNCTTGDDCEGDGGCAGTPVTCAPPNQCQNASTSCDPGGNCIYPPRTNQPCDAGTGAGTCDMNFNCNPVGNLFPTPPSNFTESQLPGDAGTAFDVTCATTINTSTQMITSTCITAMPPSAVIMQTGGVEPALLIRVPSLTVASSQVLTITGTRPVIFAVTGNVQINGTIRANNAGTPAGCGNGGNGGAVSGEGGGGGGGFGSAGALGGVRSGSGAGAIGGINGMASLTPLRGGCRGGNGNGTGGTGGAGGGAIQIVSSGTITVTSSGIVTAPGQGGRGSTSTDGSGGGGGAGGGILLEAVTIALDSSSWVSANGGGGGGGEDGGDGGNGNPGAETSLTGAGGGNGPNNAGNGGAGATRTAVATAGSPTAQNDGAGGGGAGFGRIRLNGSTSCTIDPAANRTPAFSGNGVGGCPAP